ncbi:mRNA cleavage and polyadenylation factor CLP1 p-loop domain-containing protein [Hirsutella rhossiliensis]|uniref:Polynucleotide 5'-hydroxyl-kinase GRC3 n=1 Tax=Hirsutella rhossiliensis TaxID=111463 RepID=A0A9P8SL02_9HYPO|nr:mRNA cleavage and polyadenylation factor CLP1 p-loop domain-containing protein [Hirsutella rhossiliensis]KAH0964626.1 mRNA cleavage and polyadenylation factor CLP1 p-loop domain-containing protein [Hirsutella rhossiliensis]
MPSSPNKRRKIDAPGTPQSAVSAISALAARRRLTASASADSSAPAESASPQGSSNPFSPLQQKREPVKSAKRAGSRVPAGQQGRDQGSSTDPETATSRSTSRPVTYSSFSLSKHNHHVNGQGVLKLRLEDVERFLLVGSFGIRVSTGEVTVAGASLLPSDKIYWVYAPHCHAVPVLRTAENTHVELHNDPEADNLRKLGSLSPLFQRLWNQAATADADKKRAKGPSTFQLLGDSGDVPRVSIVRELVCPPKWNKKLASLVESVSGREPLSIIICGPKSAGKSTFSKLLTNRLLTTTNAGPDGSFRPITTGVAVLDLDPGQPEYAPPGTVSLVHVTQPNLGVPFTHPSLDDEAAQVVRCHALASVNPASTTDLHLECALDLYGYYHRKLRNCPLVINTPGWILSLGLELLVEIIVKVRPGEVIYMSEEGPAETVEALRNATKNTFTSLPSQPSDLKSRTAAHFREMQTMSYFHSSTRHGSEDKRRLSWVPHALTYVRPLVVRYVGPSCGFLGVLRYDSQLPPDLMGEAINGMVLAIVEIEERQAFRQGFQEATSGSLDCDGGATPQPSISRTPEGIPFIPNPDDLTLDPRHSRTIGLALVRGIDTANKSLQILTPTPPEKISEARARGSSIVLVHGKFDTPFWSYTEHLYEQSGQGDEPEGEVEVTDEDTDKSSVDEPAHALDGGDDTAMPWVEVLRGNQKRPVGSKVWRVRRDLGRNAGGV